MLIRSDFKLKSFFSSSSFADLQYNLTADLLHKPSFSHRFYFHGNGSSDSTRGRVKARPGQLTCTTHVAYQKVKCCSTSASASAFNFKVLITCSSVFSEYRRMLETFSRPSSLRFPTFTEKQPPKEALPKPFLH